MQYKISTTSLKILGELNYIMSMKKSIAHAAENERQMDTVSRQIKVQKYQPKYTKHNLNIHQNVLLYFTVHSSVTSGVT